MSINGYDVPRVTISHENDMTLNPPGKRCAAAGLPNLPGGLMRCHSMPGRALTCPSGWLAEEKRRNHEQSAQHKETMRATSSLSASMHNGSWSELHSTIRPSTVALERCAGGGRSQGARSMRPMSQGAMSYSSYNPEKHGWHDPRGQMEQTRLNDPYQGKSWAWTMRKAKDHIGYGDSGNIGWGDVQSTAVSGDGPDWFVGTRTVPGPQSTKTVPVRRCPFVHIEGQIMRARGKKYQQGPHLNTHETMHETNKVPDNPKRKVKDDLAYAMRDINRAKSCNLMHGGCQTKPENLPLSRHVTQEGRTQRF